jgi:signal transduction histidine kinase/ActR/RegA family two-component response regulator
MLKQKASPKGKARAAPDGEEDTRAAAVRRLNLIGTPPERCFDQIAALAQAASGAPVAIVSFIDGERQWFKAAIGTTMREGQIHGAFALHALREETVLWVDDASQDDRFCDNPLVAGPPGIRFYAGAPIRLDTGEAIGAVSVVSDGPRAFDERLALQLRGLADLAADECALRACLAQLNDAREEADEARQVKSAFLTNMNHELRTPLNGVVAAADMLRSGRLSSSQQELVQIVTGSARNLCEVLDDVLLLANCASEGVHCPVERFNPADVARQAMGFYEKLALSKGLTVELDLDEADGIFLGQPASIRQILRALISNAVKFTHQGRVRLKAMLLPSGRQKSLVFCVEDTGVGFEAAALNRLFEPFAMGDESLTRSHGGLGAGLAIAQTLVRRLGGQLEAWSTLERGSTFSLAVRVAPAPVDVRPQRVTSDVAIGTCGERTPRVLVAEDHPTNRRLLELILGAVGIEAEYVENGALAVEAVSRTDFDIILMDMQMPVMDGLTAIRTIRTQQRDSGAPLTPICTITAHAMAEHEDAALQAGAQAHLTKPIAAADLFDCVTRLTGWTP